MDCVHCGKKGSRPKQRIFPRLDGSYLICGECGRAQRRNTTLKLSGRGKRAAERRLLFRAISAARVRCKFKILVWGPDPKSKSVASVKRAEIRREFEKKGHESYFSEDLGIPDVPVNVQEMFQVKSVHLGVDVAASHGSSAEFEGLGTGFAWRLLLWIPETARKGYTAEGTLHLFRAAGGMFEYFDDSDLGSCVMTLASMDWLEDKEALQIWADELRRMASRVAPAG